MSHTSIASFGAAVLALSFTPTAPAAFSSSRAADSIAAVPLGPTLAVPFGLSFQDTLYAHYGSLDTLLSSSELATLKLRPPFRTLTDADAQARVAVVRRAVLDAIWVLSFDDPCLGDNLLQLYRNRRVGLGFTETRRGEGEIREDGSGEVGDETINLYEFPCGPAPVNWYDCDWVELLVLLGHLGEIASTPGYEGPDPDTVQRQASWARTNQLREIRALTSDLGRLDALLAVVASLNNNLTLPAGAKGSAWWIGFAILNDPTLNDAARRRVALELWGLLAGKLRPRTVQRLGYRNLYEENLGYVLGGQLSSTGGYNRLIKKTGYFFEDWRPAVGEFNKAALWGGRGSFITTPALQLAGDAILTQTAVRSNGTKQDFTLDLSIHYNYLSDAKRWGTKWLMAGDVESSGEGVLRGYPESSSTGLFDETNGRELARSTNLYGGFRLEWNRSTSNWMALSLRTGAFYEFTGRDADGFPTTPQARGSLTLRSDQLGFRLARDGSWALGSLDRDLSFLGRYSYTPTARWNLSVFGSYRLAADYKESSANAALGSGPAPGATYLYATATPGWTCSVYDMPAMTPLGTAQANPAGHMVFSLISPLQAGQQFRIGSAISGWWSPTYTVPNTVQARLFTPRLVPDDLAQLQLSGSGRWPTTFRNSPDLFAWQDGAAFDSSRFGNAFEKSALDGSARFWRANQDLPLLGGPSRYYEITAGDRSEFHPQYYDRTRPDTLFGLVTAVDPKLLDFRSSGSYSYLAVTLQTAATLQYYRSSSGLSNSTNTIVMGFRLEDATPPVERDTNGVDVVVVPCLVLDQTNHYPRYQFFLAHSPSDACGEPHWHTFRSQVSPLESPQTGKLDPNPSACGFGTQLQVPQAKVRVPFDVFQDFKLLH